MTHKTNQILNVIYKIINPTYKQSKLHTNYLTKRFSKAAVTIVASRLTFKYYVFISTLLEYSGGLPQEFGKIYFT